MNRKLIAIAALSGFATMGAHAFQGEQNPLPPQTFQSTESRAAVQAEAKQAEPITNGGTGVLAIENTNDRAAVRASAVAITSMGVSTYGEVTDRRM